MTGRVPKLAASAALLVLLGSAAPAEAYRCSRVGLDFGPSLVWADRSIGWVLGPISTDDIADATVVESEVKGAFDAWTSVGCSDLRLEYGGVRADAVAGFTDSGPNVNAVVFNRTGWVYDPAVIAVTTNAFDTRSGHVFDSDIEINDQHFEFVVAESGCSERRGEMDLRNAITHEVGHLVGLDHPPLEPRFAEATMYASAPACEVKKRSLDDDDMDGLCAIYPTGQPYQQCFAPDGPSFLEVEKDDGFGCRSTSAGGGSGALMVLAGLAILRRRRSRP
jgi:MYXO-CTERM domain-containing protein